MNELVCINQQPLAVKEFSGQRVVTFKDIDGVHKRTDGTARRNFNSNKDRFIQEIDYFVRNSYEAKKEYGISAPNGLTLITQTGYLMLAKSLNDDLAWEVQRQIVDYFNNNTACKKSKPKQLKEYNYHAKYYNGIPVVTLSDIEHFTKVTSNSLAYHLRNNKFFKKNKDYFLIDGYELAKFKIENMGYAFAVNSLYLVTKSGVEKFVKLYHVPNNIIEIPALETTKAIEPVKKEPESFNLWNDARAVENFKEIKRYIVSLERVAEVLETHCLSKESCINSANTVKMLSFNLLNLCYDFVALETLH